MRRGSTRAVSASALFGIGGQGGVQGLARPVALAQRREADAVVAEQPRIARQAAQRMLVQRARLGGAAEIDQHAAEVGQHQRIVGREPRGALQRAPRLVEALQAAQRQALVVERPHVVGRRLEIGLQRLRAPRRSCSRSMWRKESCRTASRSSGLWRSARCSTSTASSVLPAAAWARASVLSAGVKAGIELERLLDRRDGVGQAGRRSRARSPARG